MIKLTLLDETEILINTDQINAVNSADQATIELKSGDKIKVKESSLTVLNLIKILAHRNKIS